MLKTIALLALFSVALPDRQAHDFAPPRTTESVTCSLSAPGTFNGTRDSGTTASLQWSSVSGAAAYRLKVYELGTLNLFSETTEYSTSKTLTGLQNGVSYRCELSSVCSDETVSGFIIIVDITS